MAIKNTVRLLVTLFIKQIQVVTVPYNVSIICHIFYFCDVKLSHFRTDQPNGDGSRLAASETTPRSGRHQGL